MSLNLNSPVPDAGGLVAAMVVLGVAVVGGGGFYLWNSSLGGDSASTVTPVITADNEPVKVKPENPGGKTVPNQDLAVYDRVSGNETQSGARTEPRNHDRRAGRCGSEDASTWVVAA